MTEQTGYRALAAEVIRLAVKDARGAYKKLRKLEKMEKAGELSDYVKNNMDTNPKAIRFSGDEMSAVMFFAEDSLARGLYGAIIDFNEIPRELARETKHFIKISGEIGKKITQYKRQATREKKGKLL